MILAVEVLFDVQGVGEADDVRSGVSRLHREDPHTLGNRGSGGWVVSGDHEDPHTGVTAGGHDSGSLLAGWIHDSHKTDNTELPDEIYELPTLCGLLLVAPPEGEKKAAEALAGPPLLKLLKLGLGSGVKLLDLALGFGIKIVVAVFEQN